MKTKLLLSLFVILASTTATAEPTLIADCSFQTREFGRGNQKTIVKVFRDSATSSETLYFKEKSYARAHEVPLARIKTLCFDDQGNACTAWESVGTNPIVELRLTFKGSEKNGLFIHPGYKAVLDCKYPGQSAE